MIKKINKKAFTIVELVIVIAVIAILAAVLIPTFSGIVARANESKAMQEAKNAWNEVSYTYVSGYEGFAADCGVMNGWYFDYIDDIAKYDIDGKYTVTYNGEAFEVTAFDAAKAKVWGAITTTSVENDQTKIGASPFGLTLTYYDTILSRGFSWITSGEQSTSKVYVVESNLGAEANFAGAKTADANNISLTGGFYSYKAAITGLSASTTYSYKAGSEGNWVYGTFRTDSANPTTITAIQLSDAQTKDAAQLNVWENTMAQAIETAGRSLDFVLYNGDQADANASSPSDFYARYGIARETVSDYVDSLPYMASSGNHEPAKEKTYVYFNTNAIDYGVDGVSTDGYSTTGGYYSYDYSFAHFVVLDSNDTSVDQINWLKADLAAASSAKWIIVMMHNGPYATGDHSNDSYTQKIIKNYTPIFSQYHVDLVLQAHDHTYNKTLPYKWDSAGYYYTDDSSVNTENGVSELGDVVNLTPVTTTYNDETYDLNPNGTYYVTTGAAGHRIGAGEADAGLWAEVVKNGDEIQGATAVSFLNNKYKNEVGKIKYANSYASYNFSGKASGTNTNVSFTSGQTYNIGDPATGNVNAQMFGVLNLTETTLTYDFYTVNGNQVKLFDTLNIMKTN